MRRKKAVKALKAKKSKKNSVKKPVASNMIEKVEKQFRQIPQQLVSQCQKEINVLKKQENKLAKTLKKAVTLSTKINKKCDALTNSNLTKAMQKKLNAAKKGYMKANEAVAAISVKIEQVTQQIHNLQDTQNKYHTINQELNQLDKTWGKKSATTAPKKSQKSTKKVSDNASSTSNESQQEVSDKDMSEVQVYESVETES